MSRFDVLSLMTAAGDPTGSLILPTVNETGFKSPAVRILIVAIRRAFKGLREFSTTSTQRFLARKFLLETPQTSKGSSRFENIRRLQAIDV